ncbi:MAG: decaprenyl-phosphate phosphoribosyltransferase [Nitrospirae bacterium]|nr:decaprenyl-phosphate phosphoribosyltransferase [Nitrospirota bacterium]
MKTSIREYLRLIRPHQYTKNLFIFLPQFFALRMTDTALFWRVCAAFIAFSLTASAVYIMNDYNDIDEDKQHPVKRKRPLASGKISKRSAVFMLTVLLTTGLSMFLAMGENIFYLALFYFIINVFYSVKLKHIAIVDIFIVASGFVIRLFAGSMVSGVELSHWIILMTFLLALFLALGKRRDDVLLFIKDSTVRRRSIDGYNIQFIDYSMIIMASVVIVAYIMYTVSPEIISKLHSNHLYLTTFFVLLGVFRYMQLAFVQHSSGAPAELLIRDSYLQLAILGWIGSFVMIIYLNY